MASNEFTPFDSFTHLAQRWWVIVLAMLAGGLVAYLFHLAQPAMYEAEATFVVTIDGEAFPFKDLRADLVQYNEDLALIVVETIVRSPEVLQGVVAEATAQGLALDEPALHRYGNIERQHATWELRFRSTSPADAQTIVNIWAQLTYQAMLDWQATGKAASFVIFNPPLEASLPFEPVIHDRNELMLAGSLLGFLGGAALASRPDWILHHRRKRVEESRIQ